MRVLPPIRFARENTNTWRRRGISSLPTYLPLTTTFVKKIKISQYDSHQLPLSEVDPHHQSEYYAIHDRCVSATSKFAWLRHSTHTYLIHPSTKYCNIDTHAHTLTRPFPLSFLLPPLQRPISNSSQPPTESPPSTTKKMPPNPLKPAFPSSPPN